MALVLQLFSYLLVLSLQGGPLTTFATFALVLSIILTKSNNRGPMGYLLLATLGFCQGVSLGPMISMAAHIGDDLVMQAVVGTALVFASFTVSALLDKTGSYIGFGGTLRSLGFLCQLMQPV